MFAIRPTVRSPPRDVVALAMLAGAALLPVALGVEACGGHAVSPAAPPTSASAAPTPSGAPSASAASATAGTARPEDMSVPPPFPLPRLPPPPPSAGSTRVTAKKDPAWAQCHRGYEARKKDVAKDVAAMAQGCAKATGFKLQGKQLSGKQSDQDPPQSFPLKAEAGRCYRVFAQGSEGIRDLDLAIKDSTGAIAGEDSTDDPSPVVLEDGAVCFKEADDATLIVSVGLGKGTYAVEIWKD
jgi:hypothetical protein